MAHTVTYTRSKGRVAFVDTAQKSEDPKFECQSKTDWLRGSMIFFSASNHVWQTSRLQSHQYKFLCEQPKKKQLMTRDLPRITYKYSPKKIMLSYKHIYYLISILLFICGAWIFFHNNIIYCRSTTKLNISEHIFSWCFHWWIYNIYSKCPPSASAHILARLWIECLDRITSLWLFFTPVAA
jgi:hypothetical protein